MKTSQASIITGILALVLIFFISDNGQELSYNKTGAKSVLNYTPEESVYFCSGTHGAAMQFNQRQLGNNMDTDFIITHTITELMKITGAPEHKISELVNIGWQHSQQCFSAPDKECYKITYKSRDIR